MTIETKFNVGDVVYYIDDNRLTWSEVFAVTVDDDGLTSSVRYLTVCHDGEKLYRRESEVHPTITRLFEWLVVDLHAASGKNDLTKALMTEWARLRAGAEIIAESGVPVTGTVNADSPTAPGTPPEFSRRAVE